MKVTLIDHTGKGNPNKDHAINMLIFTKSTRLNMSPGLYDAVDAMPYEKKLDQLRYMANTVPSSWEFVDFTFMIQNVTRAFTHQMVRTRTASYAQQAMRVLNVSDGNGWDYATGPTIDAIPDAADLYGETMDTIADAYKALIEQGASIQDARGILPTNILTNICVKMNLRAWCDLVKKRSSMRVQDEYRAVIEGMKSEVLSQFPWVDIFLSRTVDNAIKELEQMIWEDADTERRIKMTKLLDLIRSQT